MEQEPKIVLPEPIHIRNIHTKLDMFSEKGSNISKWGGYDIIDTIFYLYLFNKYKSKCLLYSRAPLSSTSIGLELLVKSRISSQEKQQYSSYYNKIVTQLTNCIKRPDMTNIIIPLYLKFAGNTGHANVLIYRKNNNEIEHFEPHGSHFSGEKKDIESIDKKLNEFILLLNKK